VFGKRVPKIMIGLKRGKVSALRGNYVMKGLVICSIHRTLLYGCRRIISAKSIIFFVTRLLVVKPVYQSY
jgi:hypothetical protein